MHHYKSSVGCDIHYLKKNDACLKNDAIAKDNIRNKVRIYSFEELKHFTDAWQQ